MEFGFSNARWMTEEEIESGVKNLIIKMRLVFIFQECGIKF